MNQESKIKGRDASVGKELAVQAWGAKFNPQNPHQKCQLWWHAFVKPVQGMLRWRSLGHSGQPPYLACQAPGYWDTLSQNKVDRSWRKIPKADLWLLTAYSNTHVCTFLWTFIHMNTHKHAKTRYFPIPQWGAWMVSQHPQRQKEADHFCGSVTFRREIGDYWGSMEVQG